MCLICFRPWLQSGGRGVQPLAGGGRAASRLRLCPTGLKPCFVSQLSASCLFTVMRERSLCQIGHFCGSGLRAAMTAAVVGKCAVGSRRDWLPAVDVT